MKADALLVTENALGWLGLVGSPKGLKAVLGPRAAREEIEREAVLLFGRLPAPTIGALPEIADALRRYAAGEPAPLTDWPVDLEDGTPFQQAVWRALLTIPPGEVMTYGEIAAIVGRPGAARAVGQAVGANPLSIVVPCHRVVGSDGALTGFGGGLAVKERLLVLEGRADAPLQRRRTERRATFRLTRRERGLRPKARAIQGRDGM